MNVKRGKKRLLIGVPILSTFVAFFGGAPLWAMYESVGKVWGAGVVFAFIILLILFFFRMLRWIVKGFDLWSDTWMSMREIETERERLLAALQENDATIRWERLRAIAEGCDPEDYKKLDQDSWWERNFGNAMSAQARSSGLKWLPEYKLYGFVFSLVVLSSSVVVGLAVLLLGPPPSP
jgi:hypothetical protein